MQRLGDDFLAQKAPGSEHEDGRAGNRERFGRDRGAEVDLVTYQDIGLPHTGEFKNRRRVPSCAAPGEALCEVADIRFRIGCPHRPAVRGPRA
ncbi:hypothetical protein R6V09_42055, partial [Streptomyces sp. W16]|uniref:hypothetical protein n=1 Tax=Streptomyces sp. W16 TaxID=3076631 RepID=UPI00295B6B36